MKGHQEKRETDEKTLRRETEEETGIQELDFFPEPKKTIRYFYRAKGKEKAERLKNESGINIFKRVVFYLAKTEVSEVRISHEHLGHKWVSYEEAKKTLIFANSKNVLDFFWAKISDLPKAEEKR